MGTERKLGKSVVSIQGRILIFDICGTEKA